MQLRDNGDVPVTSKTLQEPRTTNKLSDAKELMVQTMTSCKYSATLKDKTHLVTNLSTLKIVTWNVNSLRNILTLGTKSFVEAYGGSKKDVLKTFLVNEKIDIFCAQETRFGDTTHTLMTG